MSRSLDIKMSLEFLSSNMEWLNQLSDTSTEINLPFPIKYLYFHIGERLRDTSYSLSFILNDKPEWHMHVLGLLLRTIYTDFILAAYLYTYFEDEELMYEKTIIFLKEEISKDDGYINHIRSKNLAPLELIEKYESMKKMDGHIKNKTIEDYNILVAKYAPKRLDRFPSTTAMVNKFPGTKYGAFMAPRVYKAFDRWKLLSQFEHIGINSFLISRNPENIVTLACRSVEYILLLSNIVFDILEEKDLQKKNFDLLIICQKELYEPDDLI